MKVYFDGNLCNSGVSLVVHRNPPPLFCCYEQSIYYGLNTKVLLPLCGRHLEMDLEWMAPGKWYKFHAPLLPSSYHIAKYQDTRSCVSVQERRVAHKCVIYRNC